MQLQTCRKENLPLHSDGARLWNAMVATKFLLISTANILIPYRFVSARDWVPCRFGIDWVSDTLTMLYVFVQMLGGGMRQAGYLAAAAIYGIDHHWHRMQQDHDKPNPLGVLSKVPVLFGLVDTNIVIFELDSEARENQFMQHMQKNKIQLIIWALEIAFCYAFRLHGCPT